MAKTATLPPSTTLLFGFNIITTVLLILVFISSVPVDGLDAKSAAGISKLVDKVCRKSSSYPFCVHALYTDTRTPQADEYTLAFIAVGLAYSNATSSQDYIAKLLLLPKNQKQRLQRCLSDYKSAASSLAMAYNDLNSETFFELDDMAATASVAARDCEAAFKGVGVPSSLDKRIKDLVGLCQICAVVAKLFNGGF